MKVYDFDKTIYKGDSSIDFFLFILKKYPISYFIIPIIVIYFILYKFNIVSKIKFKEKFFSIVKISKNIDKDIQLFCDNNINKIYDWYRQQMTSSDIIISASPEFLVKKMCEKLASQKVIASVVDKKTGKFISKNCYGDEKFNRLKKEFSKIRINEFYSDSNSDLPLAKLAKKSFKIIGGKPTVWKIR